MFDNFRRPTFLPAEPVENTSSSSDNQPPLVSPKNGAFQRLCRSTAGLITAVVTAFAAGGGLTMTAANLWANHQRNRAQVVGTSACPTALRGITTASPNKPKLARIVTALAITRDHKKWTRLRVVSGYIGPNIDDVFPSTTKRFPVKGVATIDVKRLKTHAGEPTPLTVVNPQVEPPPPQTWDVTDIASQKAIGNQEWQTRLVVGVKYVLDPNVDVSGVHVKTSTAFSVGNNPDTTIKVQSAASPVDLARHPGDVCTNSIQELGSYPGPSDDSTEYQWQRDEVEASMKGVAKGLGVFAGW